MKVKNPNKLGNKSEIIWMFLILNIFLPSNLARNLEISKLKWEKQQK